MLCISCGAEMRIARIEQDAAMKASGYEHRKLECVHCGKTERRLAFSGDRPNEYRSALALLSSAAKRNSRASAPSRATSAVRLASRLNFGVRPRP